MPVDNRLHGSDSDLPRLGKYSELLRWQQLYRRLLKVCRKRHKTNKTVSKLTVLYAAPNILSDFSSRREFR